MKTARSKSRRRVPCSVTVENFESVSAHRRFEVLRECLEHRGFARASSIAFAVVVHGVDDAKSRVLLAFYNAISDAFLRWEHTDTLDQVLHRSKIKRPCRRLKFRERGTLSVGSSVAR